MSFGINTDLTFIPIKIAILTVSDTRTLAEDKSGDTLKKRIEEAGHELADRKLLRDEIEDIRKQVKAWIADPNINAIITTGGTGLTGRDITVEAVRPLFEKEIEGFSVIFHQISYGTVGLSTLQSRACAGLANATLMFCLPGSSGGVKDGWDHILKYELDARYQPCNLIELTPRYNEHLHPDK